jgi:hypothetical protein
MTAVEWFQEQIIKIVNGTCELSEIQIFEQAKEMEREQIINTYWTSYKEGQYSGDKTADEYYNETYKNTEQ